MRKTEFWNDYELIDSSGGERLERWGDVILIRPDPQVIWNTERKDPLWHNAHARYFRSNTGGGKWQMYKKVPASWQIKYRDLIFNVKPMGFKHTGIFPEQAVNWDFAGDIIKKADRQLNILNLFSYTGCATIACLKAGAKVCHVDASKGMVNWAKENAASSDVADRPVRWIVDDCAKFVSREIRRGHKYDGIIMDPPSYGRGPSGEIWKLEERIYEFVELCSGVLSENAEFVILNSYTTGLSPSVMEYLLETVIKSRFGGSVSADEIGLTVTRTGLTLPCGSTAIWRR